MSAVVVEPAERTSSGDGDEDRINHWWCCDPFRALCGADLSGCTDENEDEDPCCVVCNDLEAQDLGCIAPDCPYALDTT